MFDTRRVNIEEAVGKLSGDTLCPYPPGKFFWRELQNLMCTKAQLFNV